MPRKGKSGGRGQTTDAAKSVAAPAAAAAAAAAAVDSDDSRNNGSPSLAPRSPRTINSAQPSESTALLTGNNNFSTAEPEPSTNGISSWARPNEHESRLVMDPVSSDLGGAATLIDNQPGDSLQGEIEGAGPVQQHTNRVYYIVWVLLWILGLVNNFGYVIVLSAAKSLAEGFNQNGLIGLMQWANVAFGLLSKFVNMAFFLETSYVKRMILNTLLMGGGMVLTAVSTKVGFELAIVGISIIGTASAFGESVLLGYIKNYDPLLTGAWSSGTGGAGVFGALAYLLLKSVFHLNNLTIFCILAPSALIYFGAFALLYTKYHYKKLYGNVAPASLRLTSTSRTNRAGSVSGRVEGPVDSVTSYQLLAEEPMPGSYSINTEDKFMTGEPASAVRSNSHSQVGGRLVESPTFMTTVHTPSMSVPALAGSIGRGQIATSARSQMRLPAPPSLEVGNDSTKTDAMQDVVSIPAGYATDDEDDDLRTTMARALLEGQSDTESTNSIVGSPTLITDNAYLEAERRAGRSLLSAALDPASGATSPLSSASPTSTTQMLKKTSSDSASPTSAASFYSDAPAESSVSLGNISDDLSTAPKEPFKVKFKRVFPQVVRPAILLALVYFFEYVASGEYASKANPGYKESKNWWRANAYEILQVCYQIGVLISRSSISFIKIHRIDILCAVQGLMFVLWLIQALHPFMALGLQFGSMIFIGLLGGAMYVNVFHALAKDTAIDPADKEFAINIVSFFINLGIMVAGLFEVFAHKVFLPKDKD